MNSLLDAFSLTCHFIRCCNLVKNKLNYIFKKGKADVSDRGPGLSIQGVLFENKKDKIGCLKKVFIKVMRNIGNEDIGI